ncbi:MAG: Gfo/Idh/MocA family oxidoreductase [Chlorobi bacterium]|nr:Gfo/Idh/MocA family oxidoreductase [Chlorobiota bacterium]
MQLSQNKKTKNFAITGIAGYIAPRHLRAIKDTGNNLVAALDPHDSVGIIDSYFPNASFFTEFERFDRHIDKLRREGDGKECRYLSICSPNFLHDSHIRFALKSGMSAISEKPLVLNPWNVDALQELEEESGNRIYTVFQLRVHPAIVELKKNLDGLKRHSVELNYITSRGIWYDFSWKGDVSKSGGIASNIGIHFFDLLIHLFGEVESFSVEINEKRKMKGTLNLKNADVNWLLSIDGSDLPEEIKAEGKRTFRSIKIDGDELEFTGGFDDLHTKIYQDILDGKGLGIDEARPSIELAYRLRNEKVKE